MAEQVKAADAPAPALSFGNFADKVASPSGGFNFTGSCAQTSPPMCV